jgi:hypothetical protein
MKDFVSEVPNGQACVSRHVHMLRVRNIRGGMGNDLATSVFNGRLETDSRRLRPTVWCPGVQTPSPRAGEYDRKVTATFMLGQLMLGN